MEKIVPGSPAIKPKASKKDQYLLKRRDDARAPALPPAVLPDATPAPDDGGPPPGFPSAEPQTPPLPSSTVGGDNEEFMLQRRELPPVDQAGVGGGGATNAAAATAPKKATKPKKARKREREEGAEATADEAAAAEPKTKKKKKKLAELDGGAPSGGSAKPAALSVPKVDLDGVDLKQVISDLHNLPLLPSYGAGRRICDASHNVLLAFRSKHYKKSYENDPPEESKKSSDVKPNAAADADADAAGADVQPPKPVKKKQVMRPIDPTSAGVKRGPSDRQEELASKKKIKLEKIKNLAAEKKAGLEQKDAAPTAAATAAAVGGGVLAVQQPRAGMKDKAQGLVKKKVPAPAPARRMASPTALMMKFPPKSTLPSVASLKARFARFGPLDIDGIRVYWKSHMCRVIYKFQSDAENALKYAKANAMFGQVVPNYHLRGIEGADPGPEPAPAQQQQRSDLRLMETTPFRPGSSGNGAPLTLSRAAPARTAVGQPKSILKKGSDDGPASALRDSPRVKFMLDGGDSKLEPPALPASGITSNVPDAAAPVSKIARSVGFAQQPLQPPARPAQPNLQPAMRAQQQQMQPPRALDAQQLPPPPPLPYQPRVSEPSPYQPRQTDVPPSFNMQPPYQARHIEVPLMLSGQATLPYPPRAGFPSHQYSPRSDEMPPSHFDNNAVNALPAPFDNKAVNAMPVWKRGEKEFNEELMRVMLGIAKLVEPLMDKNGNFPYHLFGRSA